MSGKGTLLGAVLALLLPPLAAQTWDIQGPGVAYRLEADPAAGALLTTVTNPITGAVAANDTILAPSMWEVVLYNPTDPANPKVITGLSGRDDFQVRTRCGRHTLTWTGVQVPGSPDKLDVSVQIKVPRAGDPLDFAGRWQIRVTPRCLLGAETRIFKVNFPIMAFDPLDNGLLTADLLAGCATPQAVFPFTLILDLLGSQRFESVHPGKGSPSNFLQPLAPGQTYTDLHIPKVPGRQTFQFFCLRHYELPGVPSTAPLKNELLWLGSDDTQGHYKTYNWETIAEAAPIPHTAIRWSVGHYAPMDPDPRNPLAWPFQSPYSCLVGLRPYQGPEWWFDVVEPYRDWVKRRRMVTLGPIERNPIFRQSSFDDNSIYQGTVSYYMEMIPGPFDPTLQDNHLAASVQLAKDFAVAFPDTPMNIQWQFITDDGVEPTTPTTPPVFPGLRGAIQEVHQALPEAAIAYYHRFDLPVNETPPPINPAARFDYGIYNLDGTLRIRDDLGLPLLNLGAAEARNHLFTRCLLPYACDIGASGVYIDGLTGSGPKLSYGNWTAPDKYLPHIPGGGSYWQAGKRMYAAMAQATVKLSHPCRPAFVLSEHTGETMAGWLDGCGQQAGRIPYVDHRIYLPPLPGPGTFDQNPDVPFLPPLWDAIYHQYQPTMALNLLHSTDWLASRGGPLPDAAFMELALYSHMVDFVTGSNPFTFLVTTDSFTGTIPDFGEPLFQVAPDGTLQPTDPAGTGLALMERLKDLWRARQEHVGGPWLLRGRMERPMSVVRFRTALHPLRYLVLKDLHPEGPFLSFPRNVYDPIVYSVFPALTTYHTVWSAPDCAAHTDGRLVALVNWTDQPSDYALRFNPADYFGEGTGSCTVYAVDINTGARTPLAQDLAGPTILDFGGNYGGSGDRAALPAIPGRSVVLYEIR